MSQQPPSGGPKLEFDVHFRPGKNGRRVLADGPAPEATLGREDLPRVTRLLALAHRWNGLLERGEVRDQAEIARLMGLTRARVTQIMNLLWLSPEIQKQLLTTTSKSAAAPEKTLRMVLSHVTWRDQNQVWTATTGTKLC